MSRTVVSVILALAPTLVLWAEGPGSSNSGAQAAQQTDKKGDESAKTGMQAIPAESSAGPVDPLKMADPKAAPGAKVPGAAPVDEKSFVIGPEDVLGVYVYGQKDFDLPSYLVRPDGMITVPLAGDIRAAGRTPIELASTIGTKLKEYYQDPQVIVTVLQVHSKKYRIQGEVLRPGENDLIRPTTVLEALANAGGFRDFADLKHIKILRSGGRTILNFNYKDVINGKHLEQNVLLQPDDIIVVK